jgi:protein-disulfide isomerase
VHDAPAPPSTIAACTATEPEAAVAHVGGEPVTAAELDATIALRLHDFDMARYELRAARLRELLLSRVLGPGAAADGVSIAEYVRRQAAAAGLTDAAFVDAAFERAGVTIELTPPDPPIVDVSVDDDPVRGNGDAPITIVLFCDFQSPYCRAMQPVLQRLLAAYPTQVRLVDRDFRLPLHREAQSAAEAAECARRQGGYWPYHDALLQAPGDLGRAALSAHAQRVGIDVARLVACLDAHEARTEVDADAADARRLGLSVVPTTFVDGRYLRGPQTYEALRAQVDAALRRRGLPVPSPLERTAAAPAPTTTPASVPAPVPSTAPPPSEAGGVPSSTIALSRALVEQELADRPRLERDLEHPTADLGPGYEQRAVVRVGAVRAGGLYEAMGLQAGDVVMRVDGTLLLDRGDALFDALGARPSVTVLVMRRGFPYTFEYRIQ